MKKSQKRKTAASAARVNELLMASKATALRRMIDLAMDERERGREDSFESIMQAVDAARAQLLCERMGWPAGVSAQLARTELRHPRPSDRLICVYAGGITPGCSYSEPLQAGRVYVARDVAEDGVVRLVGILGGLCDDGTEQGWLPQRFIVLEDVKEAFAAVRASMRG